MSSTPSTNNQCNVDSAIDIPISDYILTPLSCASLINEVMKNLLYQRSQIPYPYTWLKSIVRKKRQSEDEHSKPNNYTVSRHFQVVSSVYDAAENIMTNINKHFTHLNAQLKEVVFVIGVSPFSPKEIFTVRVSSLAFGHLEQNHVAENSKKQCKVLRNIFLTENWMNLLHHRMVCTNTYIFLKISGAQHQLTNLCNESVFVPSKPLFFPSKVRHTVITLNYSNATTQSCCDNLQVFQDLCDSEELIEEHRVQQGEDGCSELTWLQSNILIQGFKDCFINKVSASELW